MTSLNVWTVWVGPGWACLLPPDWSFWSDLNVLLIRTDLLSQDSGSSIKWSFIKLSLMTFFLFSLSFWTSLDLLLSWRPVLSLLIVTCCYCAGTVERLVWAETIKEWREAADNRLQNCRTTGQCWVRVGWRGHEEGENLCWEYPDILRYSVVRLSSLTRTRLQLRAGPGLSSYPKVRITPSLTGTGELLHWLGPGPATRRWTSPSSPGTSTDLIYFYDLVNWQLFWLYFWYTGSRCSRDISKKGGTSDLW